MAEEYQAFLSAGAESDLEAIFDYTLERWGTSQAEALLADLLATTEGIARAPERGVIPMHLRSHGVESCRQVLCGSYRLLYEISENKVVVMMIVHERRNYRALLEERLFR